MSHSAMMPSTAVSTSNLNSIHMYPDSDAHLEDLSKQTWALEPGILQSDTFPHTFAAAQYEEGDHFQMSEAESALGFIAPDAVQPLDVSFYPPNMDAVYDGFLNDFSQMQPPPFPVPSPASAVSPVWGGIPHQPSSLEDMSRAPSVRSMGSSTNKGSPQSMTAGSEEDTHERGRCPYEGCGRIFKDLRAHRLTHQSERPEKCPIEKCLYHIKGFARKYDQTRHTLTHYKGTMVCGFCPGSGSAGEKSFNRADVFKRHLTSVHGVEQMPANSRRKSPVTSTSKRAASKDENKEGKCSTCGIVFGSAQDFYNHLDDCVMKILEKPDVSEAYNEKHIREVAGDQNVKATLKRNNLPIEVEEMLPGSDEENEDMANDDEGASETKDQAPSSRHGKSSRSMTRSKGGVPTISKGRRKRKDYPHSWGCGKDQMKMKKRVLCVFDGQRRLWKDEMMMDNDYEVRVPLPSGNNQYVTDLDVMTMSRADRIDYLTVKRAEAFHDVTSEEKGPWLKDEEVTKLML